VIRNPALCTLHTTLYTALFIRDKRDDGNSIILRRHSGHGRAVIRNPASPVIARSVEVEGGDVAIPEKKRFL
jgi:hypothetical protein